MSSTLDDALLTKSTALIFYNFSRNAKNPILLKKTLRAAMNQMEEANLVDRLQPLLMAKVQPHLKKGGKTT